MKELEENIFFNRENLRSCGRNVIIGKTVRIRHPELVDLGDNVIIDDFTMISGSVVIGDYVHIGSSCSLQAGSSTISIGSHSGLGAGVRIFAVSADFLRCSFDSACYPRDLISGAIIKKVSIDKYNMIGANSVILPGVVLPEGFACSTNSNLADNHLYKPWHLLTQNPLFECRRLFKNEFLERIKSLS